MRALQELKGGKHSALNIAIQINCGPQQHQAADTAFNFVKAAICKTHRISCVFFYHDGVFNASSLIVSPADDRNPSNRWAELKQIDGSPLNLVICITSALGRGLLDEKLAEENNRQCANLHPAFCIGGLGQLVKASIESERFITFG